jgi:hypothetical protein
VDDMPRSLPEMRKHGSYTSMPIDVVKVRNPLGAGSVGMHDNVDPNYFIDKARREGKPYVGEWELIKHHTWRRKCIYCYKHVLRGPIMRRRDFTTGRWTWAHEHCVFLSEL